MYIYTWAIFEQRVFISNAFVLHLHQISYKTILRGLYKWEKPGLYFLFMCRVTMRIATIVVEIGAYLAEDVQGAF